MQNEETKTLPTSDSEVGLLAKLYRRFKKRYVYTIDMDGTIRKARRKTLPNGQIMIKKIYGWVIAEADGTIKDSYVKKWFEAV